MRNRISHHPCIQIASQLHKKSLKYHHHHKQKGLDPLICSVSTVTAARANASSVFQLFSFLAVCSGTIAKGFGFVEFFASVKASSVCIHNSFVNCKLFFQFKFTINKTINCKLKLKIIFCANNDLEDIQNIKNK